MLLSLDRKSDDHKSVNQVLIGLDVSLLKLAPRRLVSRYIQADLDLG